MTSNHSEDETHETVDSWTSQKLHQSHFNDGYREGIDHGRESTLQEGFDNGYLRGFESAFRVSIIRGMLSGLAMQAFEKPSTRQSLLEVIENMENSDNPQFRTD